MARWNLLMGACAVAAGTIGCAHCDTCDDFPVPCVGANCGGPTMAYAGPGMGDPMMGSPSTGGGINAPAGSELGPYGSQGGATVGAGGGGEAPVPSNPNPPGDTGLVPPSDSPPAAPANPGS